MPVIEKELVKLEEYELLPFAENSQKAFGVMTAHIRFPLVDTEISTFSAYWIRQYLREKLQFKGIVMTDDLGMQATAPKLSQKNIVTAALKASDAGADILLFAEGADRFAMKSFEALLKRMSNSEFKKRIVSSVQKIIYFKLKMGLYQPYLNDILKEIIQDISKGSSEDDSEEERDKVRIHLHIHTNAVKSIMEYMNEQEKRRNSLREEAPSPSLISKELVRDGIKYLIGSPTEINFKKSVLFTNEDREKFDVSLLKKFSDTFFSYHSLNRFGDLESEAKKHSDQKEDRDMIIFHKGEELNPELTSFLMSPHRKDIIFITNKNPFPRSKLGKFFRETDSLIISFSGNLYLKKFYKKR